MWTEITTPETLETILSRQGDLPVLLFKHSTRCPISARALRAVESWLAEHPNLVHPCRILVVEHRAVSNLAAERLGIRHESPQAMLLRDGRVVWHASHLSIQGDALDAALRQSAVSS
ncbi:MAG TPA: bacillithiol system redox-active protein YtxJ [Candidatus Hydrogenedentes bacterium]|nr:bacillithiol system redox-active protein YtxJ [Candidatus Hydrogenedentota bacterium]HOJ70137.1 bacillithiol system redox-active protein YtxJ [Candidatus Hydrogenedentota bacterium]HOK89874.1 bacillithiol system redox-active protein YtxJ [Candidatus Hydrogenedentota bacterium]HPO29900.1 bacillithiol system redox-active protein YtxJ [Candidatus Hydrogenedentota bacterium]